MDRIVPFLRGAGEGVAPLSARLKIMKLACTPGTIRTFIATAAGRPWWWCIALLVLSCGGTEVDRVALAGVDIPPEHTAGAALYEMNCLPCHGPQGTGTDVGPPLVHPVYRTRHHGDEAFQLAVAQGVRGHHFRFGDMAPVPGLDRQDVAAITAYIRFLQRAAGIE
jgi:cytochrome c